MWNNREFWRRLIATLLSATEQGRLEWTDTLDEPTMRSFYSDGMIHLRLPEGGGGPPEVVVFGRWHEILATFRPEQADDVALAERLYRLVEQTCHHEDVFSTKSKEGDLITLAPVLKAIAAEVTAQPRQSAGNVAVGTKARR